MDADAVVDLLFEIDLGDSPTKADDLERAGRALAPDEHGFATFLASAADHRLRDGELDRARALLTEAGPGLPGELLLDVRTRWLQWELRAGDPSAVDARVDELRRAWRDGELSTSSCHHVGDLLRSAGDHTRALRWLTFPLTHADLSGELDPAVEMCLLGRHALRRELGLGVDGLDRDAAALIAELAELDELEALDDHEEPDYG